MTTAIIIIVILLTLAYFYLKCPLMTSLATFLAAVFATLIAFSAYEAAANFLIARGYGGGWAFSGSFAAVFIFSFAGFRALVDYLIGSNIDLGPLSKVAAAIVCGVLTGMIFSGNILVTLGLMPLQNKILYTRFPSEKPIVLSNPSVPILNPDGFVTGLYGWLSRGALASDTSFSVVRADFLTQCHLNRYRINEEVQAIASPDCLVLPPKSKKPLRLWTIPEKGNFTILRVGIAQKNIVDGGAMDNSGQIKFSMAQLRLICKPAEQADNLRGKGIAVWPAGLFKNKVLVEKALEDMPEESELLGSKDRVLWVDLAFKVAEGQVPVAFQFKQNAMIGLIGVAPVATSPEIEQELDTEEKKTETQQAP